MGAAFFRGRARICVYRRCGRAAIPEMVPRSSCNDSPLIQQALRACVAQRVWPSALRDAAEAPQAMADDSLHSVGGKRAERGRSSPMAAAVCCALQVCNTASSAPNGPASATEAAADTSRPVVGITGQQPQPAAANRRHVRGSRQSAPHQVRHDAGGHPTSHRSLLHQESRNARFVTSCPLSGPY